MNLESRINSLNENFFFQEFTYSRNTFKRADGLEIEIADSIIFLDDVSFVFQFKERNAPEKTTQKKEQKWFEKKVLRLATKQIRDTVRYITDYDEIVLSNNRGHSINIISEQISNPCKIVIHQSSEFLPDAQARIKFHISSSVGTIHILQAHDYYGLVNYLITPSELYAYFEFRTRLINQYQTLIHSISEPALLGQYFLQDNVSPPSAQFTQVLAQLNKEVESWDMTGIIKLFSARIVGEQAPTDYYYILKEIAKLMRNELREFKNRFMRSWEDAKENKQVLPYRFYIPRTGCSFLFIPLQSSQHIDSQNYLIDLTHANHYDMKSAKSIGVSFISLEPDWQDIQWCYIKFEWKYDREFETHLNKYYPFRKTSTRSISRYSIE